MSSVQVCRIFALSAAVALGAAVINAQPPRIFAELETSALNVTNDVAEATFKVVVRNEEETALSAVFLVFDDGYEVAVGDVAAESSAASEAITRTFDLSQHVRSLAVAMPATLKYSAGGASVEQAATVVLHLDNQ